LDGFTLLKIEKKEFLLKNLNYVMDCFELGTVHLRFRGDFSIKKYKNLATNSIKPQVRLH
jgi:hypothetical protein